MAKKNYRGNNTYLIEGNTGDNPKLMGQSLSDGRDSLYLEFYFGYQVVESKNGNTYKKVNRSTERLGLYLWQAPRTQQERQQNKETLEIAKRVRFERGQDLLKQTEGYRLEKHQKNNVDLIVWMRSYVDHYTKGDKRVIKHAFNCFVFYLVDPNNSLDASKKAELIERLTLKPNQLTKQRVRGFADYLQSRFIGDGPSSCFKRFKKIISAAVEDDILRANPCKGIIIKNDDYILKKDILSIEEMQTLISTHYPGENTHIRRAFIFCLYSGLRWCDVKDLTFANVDYSNRLLMFEQAKTKGHSSASGVVIPLNDGLLNLIGQGQRDELIFRLPSHTMCLKALRHWTKRARIEKHITWHCARHSFAVNILNNGANIKTVASLLGHSGLSQTEKYTRAVDSLKEAAINSLPKLEI
ncbi:MAG: site-specific integrase [Muribaculaceae bacterium]|nr:site-specific integrase [Muribaculaceae bacterium]